MGKNHGLIENIAWLIKSLFVVTIIWTFSIGVGMRFLIKLEEPIDVIMSTLLFFGTFYYFTTLDFGDPPSRLPHAHEKIFEMTFGVYTILFSPAIGGITAYYLFFS